MSQRKHVITEMRDRTLIVALRSELGSLPDEQRDEEFDETVGQAADPQVLHVLVDLKDASYFGSQVLEWMVRLWKRVCEKEPRAGQMALCNVSRTAREILSVSRFDTLWPIHDSREQALESFDQP